MNLVLKLWQRHCDRLPGTSDKCTTVPNSRQLMHQVIALHSPSTLLLTYSAWKLTFILPCHRGQEAELTYWHTVQSVMNSLSLKADGFDVLSSSWSRLISFTCSWTVNSSSFTLLVIHKHSTQSRSLGALT